MTEPIPIPELEQLLAEFPTAGSNPSLFMIKGAAGIGKTALVYSVLKNRPRTNWLTASFSNEQETGLIPIIQLLLQLEKNDKQKFNQSADLSVLGHILPGYPTLEILIQKEMLFEAIRNVLDTFGKQSSLGIVLENIQWADSASLDLLDYLLHAQSPLPCPILVTQRSDSLGLSKSTNLMLNRWQYLDRAKIYTLKPFTEAQTCTLITQTLKRVPTSDFCKIITQKTDGNPLFIKEIITILKLNNKLIDSGANVTIPDDVAFPIPNSLAILVEMKMGTLSSDAREALELAATSGMVINLFQLAEWLDKDTAIDELLSSGFLKEVQSNQAVFQHQLIRETIYQRISWSKRRQLNKQLAERAEQQGESPERLAHYWQRAGQQQKARKYFIQAGQHFCKLFAHTNAIEAATNALEDWKPGEDEVTRLSVLKMIAECHRLNGEMHEAIRAYHDMLKSEILQSDSIQQALVHRSVAACYALQGSWSYFEKSKQTAADLFLSIEEYTEASQDFRETANRMIDDLQFFKANEFAQKALDIALLSNDIPTITKSKSLLAYVKSMVGQKEEGIELANEAVANALSANHFESAAYAYRKLAGVLEYASDFGESAKVYEFTRQFCETRQMNTQAMLCLSCMSWVLFRCGDWRRALDVSQQVADDTQINQVSRATAHMVIGLIRAYRGEIKTADKHLQQSRFIIEKEHFRLITFLTAWGEAVLAEQEQNHKKAFDEYQKILEDWKGSDDRHDILPVLIAACQFFRRRGHERELNETVQIASQIATQMNNPEAFGAFSFALGQIMLLLNKPADAVNHFTKAIQHFSGLVVPLQLLHARANLGESLLLIEEYTKGMDIIRQSIVEARNIGLRPFAAELESLLATHTTKEQKNISEQLELTARQMEVLRALAEGLANKEIASKLHLSTRTVDMHVRNILDRLNCRSRTDAVRVAVERGWL